MASSPILHRSTTLAPSLAASTTAVMASTGREHRQACERHDRSQGGTHQQHTSSNSLIWTTGRAAGACNCFRNTHKQRCCSWGSEWAPQAHGLDTRRRHRISVDLCCPETPSPAAQLTVADLCCCLVLGDNLVVAEIKLRALSVLVLCCHGCGERSGGVFVVRRRGEEV